MKIMRVCSIGLASAAMTAGLSPLSSAIAAPALEEVLVTATLRTESLQDVPVSVNAVSGEKMQEAGIDKIEDLQAYVGDRHWHKYLYSGDRVWDQPRL